MSRFYQYGQITKDGPIYNTFTQFQNSVQNAKLGISHDVLHKAHQKNNKHKFFYECEKKALELTPNKEYFKNTKGCIVPGSPKSPRAQIKAWTDPKKDQDYLSLGEYLSKKTPKTNKKLFYL